MENLDAVLKTDIADTFDAENVQKLISAKPFLPIDGGFNTRDLSDATYPALRPGYAFRSGSLERLTKQGQQDLRQLGIRTIFDLRSPEEINAHSDPTIEGVELVIATIESNWRAKAVETGPDDLVSMYTFMLESNKSSWRSILEHIRDQSEQPFLLHCTAGKDRTGVAAALILGIAGLPLEYISRDYALTRIGIEPVRELLNRKLPGGKPVDLRSMPLLHRMAGARTEDMAATLQKVEKEYGSVEGYAKQVLDFSDDDLARMRVNLEAPDV